MKLNHLVFLIILICSCNSEGIKNTDKQVTIVLQPFSDFPKEKLVTISNELKLIVPQIQINAPIPLPATAYNTERNRYRADTIIAYLAKNTESGKVTIGLTTKDISTTKGDHKDWGVMGLGYRPGKACIVSSFRVSKRNNSQFYKVCIHELAHTAGLDHCPQKTCFMRDAEGGNPLDEETEFCTSCHKYLVKKGWSLSK